MPFVNIKTNVVIPQNTVQKIHSEIDSAVALIPAIEKGWTMTNFEDNCQLWFENSNSPAAMIEVAVWGDALDDNCQLVTEKITDILNNTLLIDKNRIYINFKSAPYWGCDGNNY